MSAASEKKSESGLVGKGLQILRGKGEKQKAQSGTDERTAALERRAFESLDDKHKFELYKQAAMETARLTAADAVREAISEAGMSLRDIEREVGMPPSRVSEIATAAGEHGPKLWSLCLIARALDKRLRIVFE